MVISREEYIIRVTENFEQQREHVERLKKDLADAIVTREVWSERVDALLEDYI